MGKVIKTALLRDLESKVLKEEISYSKMVELLNEKAKAHASEWQSIAEKLAEALEDLIDVYKGELDANSISLFIDSTNSAITEYEKLKETALP